MAIWQYDIFLIPSEKLSQVKKVEEGENSLSFFDDSLLWKERKMLIVEFEDIKRFLGVGKSWNKDLIVFGELEKNCVKVFLDNEKFVASVSARIDFRSNYKELLEKIINFCKQNNLAILIDNMFSLPLNVPIIEKYIEESSQMEKYKSLLKG